MNPPGNAKAFAGQRDDPFFGDVGAIFDLVGWTEPNAHYQYVPKTKSVEPTGISVSTTASPLNHGISRPASG